MTASSSSDSITDFLKNISDENSIQNKFSSNGSDLPMNKKTPLAYDTYKKSLAYVVYKKEAMTIKNKIDNLEKDLQKQIVEVNKEINKDKSSLITILWIFIAFFTFVSMEIDVLKKVPDFQGIAWFSLLFLCLLSIFVFMLDFVAWRWRGVDSKLGDNDTKRWNIKNWFGSISSYFRVWLFFIIVFWLWGVYLIKESQSSFEKSMDTLQNNWTNLQKSLDLVIEDMKELQNKNNLLSNEIKILQKENDITLQLRTQNNK